MDSGASEPRVRVLKSPYARKASTRQGERKMRDYWQSPSFWTYALLLQRKTLIGSSMEICQHLSKRPSFTRNSPEKKLVSGFSNLFLAINIPRNLPMTRAMRAQWEKETHWMCLIHFKGYTNFTLQNQSAVKRQSLGFVYSPSFFSLPATSRLSCVRWFSVAFAFRSLYHPCGEMETPRSLSKVSKRLLGLLLGTTKKVDQ